MAEPIELTQTWRPGGAQGASGDALEAGKWYLLARWWPLSGRWGYHTECAWRDANGTIRFDNGYVDWSRVAWYVPCEDIDLPVPEERPNG